MPSYILVPAALGAPHVNAGLGIASGSIGASLQDIITADDGNQVTSASGVSLVGSSFIFNTSPLGSMLSYESVTTIKLYALDFEQTLYGGATAVVGILDNGGSPWNADYIAAIGVGPLGWRQVGGTFTWSDFPSAYSAGATEALRVAYIKAGWTRYSYVSPFALKLGGLNLEITTSIAAAVNTVLPAISGTARRTKTLSSSQGSWNNVVSALYEYRWKRNGSNISGATSPSYTLVAADVGQSITCAVTCTNESGTPVTATSAATVPLGYNSNRTIL